METKIRVLVAVVGNLESRQVLRFSFDVMAGNNDPTTLVVYALGYPFQAQYTFYDINYGCYFCHAHSGGGLNHMFMRTHQILTHYDSYYNLCAILQSGNPGH